MDQGLDALAAEQSPDAVIIVAEDGTVLLWNGGAEVLFGYSREEAIGRNQDELIVPAERAVEERELIARAISQGSATFESLRRRKDGTLLYVAITDRLVRHKSHDGPLVLSTKKDITRLRVEREAARVDQRFRELLDSMPDGIVIVDPTGHIVCANSQAEVHFGYQPGELRSRQVEELLPHRFRSSHLGHRTGYFGQPRTRAMGAGLELFGLRKDGSEFPVEISLSPLGGDETMFAVSAIRDITDRKLIEQELREKNLALESASRAKSRFHASMSHELRTPLNSIIGFTGTLLMRMPGPLNEAQEKQLQTVQTSARHLLALINDLLDVARIEAEQPALNWERVDCVDVIHEVVASLRIQAEEKGLGLSVSTPADSLVWLSDRRTLSQIVLNLVGNAIKFTDEGSVRVELARSETEDSAGIRISVTDTGPGIAAEDMPKLFRAFSRMGGTSQRAKSGAGLGLHLSQRLAELLGGAIAVRSEPGRGSEFTLQLQES
jgi:PAS domain S-box-containing protein